MLCLYTVGFGASLFDYWMNDAYAKPRWQACGNESSIMPSWLFGGFLGAEWHWVAPPPTSLITWDCRRYFCFECLSICPVFFPHCQVRLAESMANFRSYHGQYTPFPALWLWWDLSVRAHHCFLAHSIAAKVSCFTLVWKVVGHVFVMGNNTAQPIVCLCFFFPFVVWSRWVNII